MRKNKLKNKDLLYSHIQRHWL